MNNRTIAIAFGLLLLAAPASAQKASSEGRGVGFCGTLQHYLESAGKRFSDEEGAVDTPPTDDGSSTFVAKRKLEGAKDCIVYHEEKPTGPWIDCEFVVDGKDALATKSTFDAMVKKVDACFATGFARDKGKRLDGRQDYVDYTNNADPDGAYVSVERTKSKDKGTYEVVVDVTVPDEDKGGD